EGAPELAGDDAALLRHGAARWPAAPGRRRRAGGPLHRRQVLLLQGLRHRRPGEPPQAWVRLPFALRLVHMQLIQNFR
uniref:Uncharacterized protein n=1 Tax=Aegilops tauschii subsp. strangulata TaxID=200361 RepID=A0A453H6K4_AEGTS